MKKIFAFLAVLTAFLLVVMPVSAKKDNTCATIKDGSIVDGAGDPVVIGYNDWGYNYQAHMFNSMWCDYHPTYRPGGANHDWCVNNMADVELMMKWSDTWLSNKDCNGDNKLDRGYSCNPDNPTSSACPGAWLTNHERGSYKSLVGDWVISVDYGGTKYNHDMEITEQNTEFNLSGIGHYPAGGPYTINWTLVNSYFSGDNVHLVLDYDGSSYVATLDGTINPDGSMSGTWSSNTGQSGDWTTTSGAVATCEYNVFTKMVTPSAEKGDYNADGVWYNADGEEIGAAIWGAYAITQIVKSDTCAETQGLQYKSSVSPGLGYYTPQP